jgi:hypothetical protein
MIFLITQANIFNPITYNVLKLTGQLKFVGGAKD